MSFTATTDVVETMRWRHITKLFLNMLHAQGIELDKSNENKILNHYGYLLQLTSWKRNINWEPALSRVTVVVPNEWGHDTIDFNSKVHRDDLANELIKIMGEVPVERVLSHFATIPTGSQR
jgi:hypothetical protein